MKSEKILMFGGKSSGKSSVLSAIFDQAVSLTANLDLSIKLDRESAEPLLEKLHMVKSVSYRWSDDPFEMPGIGTSDAEEYSFELGVSTKEPDLQLTFVDTAGGWMSQAMDKLDDYFAECHAAILAIDAVELLEGSELMLSDPSLYHNLPDHTRQLVARWLETQGDMPRLLCIVPIKTETYGRVRDNFEAEAKMQQLTEVIAQRYQQTFATLRKNAQWTAVVLTPVQTLGNIVFSHYQARADGQYPQIFWRSIKGDDTAEQEARGYQPLDCDQPLRHILNFFLIQQVNAAHSATRQNRDDTVFRRFWKFVGLEEFYQKYVETLVNFGDILGKNRAFIQATSHFSQGTKTTPPFQIIQGEHLLTREKTLFSRLLSRF